MFSYHSKILLNKQKLTYYLFFIIFYKILSNFLLDINNLFCVNFLLSMSVVNLELIKQAAENIKPVVKLSDLQFCERLSKQYQAEIYLKWHSVFLLTYF